MQYGAILLDPPWAFKTFNELKGTTPHRGANDHYKTLRLHELAGLPVPDLAAKNCALFMWSVGSHLPEVLKLMDVWGFTYKTDVFYWEKLAASGEPRIGMGYWSRKQVEPVFLGTKGSPRRQSKGVRQLIQAPRREHSRKPDEIYERIEALVPGPYLEMFARQRWPGWDAWGNEVGKFPSVEDMFAE